MALVRIGSSTGWGEAVRGTCYASEGEKEGGESGDIRHNDRNEVKLTGSTANIGLPLFEIATTDFSWYIVAMEGLDLDILVLSDEGGIDNSGRVAMGQNLGR